MKQLIISILIVLIIASLVDAADLSDTGSFRIMVEFDTGTGPINNNPVRLEVYFYKILQDMGVDGVLDLDSVRVVEYDKATGTPKVYNPAETGDKKYEIPFRIFSPSHTHTPVASHYLSWIRQNAGSCLFAINFDLLDVVSADGPDTFPMIGGGEPIIASSGGLDMNGLSGRFAVGDMNGDLVEDFVGGSYNEIGYVQMSVNLGTRANPVFSNWKRLEKSNGEFINELIFNSWLPGGYMQPKIYDFDSDGDLDLYADANPWYAATTSYHENIGGFYKPVFKRATLPYSLPADTKGAWSGRADWDGDGGMETVSSSIRALYYEGSYLFDLPDAVSQICAYDWDNDTDKDIIVMTHGGTMYFCRNSGSANFSQPQIVPAQNANLSSGSFSTPWVADWDGDGDLDLFSGNEAGQILYYENIGSRFDPIYIQIGFVEVQGTRIDYPGENWNATELTWGYSMPTIVDWDGDGDLDLIGSERLGFHNYYENIGDSTTPVLAAAVRLKYAFDGSPIQTDPRVRPAIYDWDNDGDLDLIMTHTNGYAAIYKNTNAHDKITFLPPQTLYNPSAQPIYTELYSGQGRTKYAPIDWDGDGDKDLMTTDHLLNYWPRYFENIGTVSSPQFIERDEPKVKGTHLWVEASHEMAICPVDWDNDGREDILLGGEDGHVYYYNRKMFDPQPALKSAVIHNLTTGDIITSQLDDYFDIDTNIQAGEIFRDDLNLTVPPPPGSGWSWSSNTSFMHNQDMLAIWGASGTEQITFSPGLTGVYDIYVGLRHVTNPTGLKLALSGDSSWFTISLPGSGGNDKFYQRYWKQADMTGKYIYILPVAGTTVYLDFLKFVPVGNTYLPIYDISYNPGTVTLKCRHLSGKKYNIYYANEISSGEPDWQLAEGNIPVSANGNLEWTDSGDTGSGRPAPDDPSVTQRYYLILETGQ